MSGRSARIACRRSSWRRPALPLRFRAGVGGSSVGAAHGSKCRGRGRPTRRHRWRSMRSDSRREVAGTRGRSVQVRQTTMAWTCSQAVSVWRTTVQGRISGSMPRSDRSVAMSRVSRSSVADRPAGSESVRCIRSASSNRRSSSALISPDAANGKRAADDARADPADIGGHRVAIDGPADMGAHQGSGVPCALSRRQPRSCSIWRPRRRTSVSGRPFGDRRKAVAEARFDPAEEYVQSVVVSSVLRVQQVEDQRIARRVSARPLEVVEAIAQAPGHADLHLHDGVTPDIGISAGLREWASVFVILVAMIRR